MPIPLPETLAIWECLFLEAHMRKLPTWNCPMKHTFGVWFPIEQVHVLGVFILRMFLWHCPSRNEPPKKTSHHRSSGGFWACKSRNRWGAGVIAGLHAMNKTHEAFEIPMDIFIVNMFWWLYIKYMICMSIWLVYGLFSVISSLSQETLLDKGMVVFIQLQGFLSSVKPANQKDKSQNIGRQNSSAKIPKNAF